MEHWSMDNIRRRWLPGATLGICIAATTAVSWATHQVPSLAISIGNLQPLVFGKFAAGSGGTVTVNSGGARTATGGVILLSSGSGSAASFRISGDAGLTYDIVLPANGVVALGNGTGQTMPVSDFTGSPAGTGQLDPSGVQTVSIGATLNVGAGQAPGDYSGSFDVTVDYN